MRIIRAIIIGSLWYRIFEAHSPNKGEDINWPMLKNDTTNPKNAVLAVLSISCRNGHILEIEMVNETELKNITK